MKAAARCAGPPNLLTQPTNVSFSRRFRVALELEEGADEVSGAPGCEVVIEKGAGFQWFLPRGMGDIIRGGSDSELIGTYQKGDGKQARTPLFRSKR